jgi:putative DNA primase/helicase
MDRSLTITLDHSAPDGFLVHSFAGDDAIACKDYVRTKCGAAPWNSTYEYRHPASGKRVYAKQRVDRPDGSKEIKFIPRRIGEPLLYGGERLADLGEGQPVFIVEGEKKVDRLREFGAIGVCTDSGAKSEWLPSHAQLLRGLRILLWPDSDVAGEGYISAAAAAIRDEDPEADIRVVRPFGLPNGVKGRDVCDWTGDADALAQLIADAVSYEPFIEDRARAQKPETFLIKASEIKPVPISWLWKYWLARGKLHLIAGAPGGGKTTIYLSFAAIISSGGTWPDGTRAAVGNVLIWTSEDGHADTIIPRLMRMDANLDRIFIVRGQSDAKGTMRAFNPATDMESLREKAAAIPGGVDFVFLDPVVATVNSTKNGDKNVETRAGLAPFVEFAEAINAAAGGVTHVSKGTGGKDPLERVTGSLAYGAVPRIVVLGAENKAVGDDEPERIMVRAKNNIGPKDGGFGYHIDTAYLQENPDIEATRIVWELPLEGTALELLNAAEGDSEKVSKLDEAKRFLRAALAKGERSQKEIQAAAQAQGITWGTLKRASEGGEIGKRKDGFGCWLWSLS